MKEYYEKRHFQCACEGCHIAVADYLISKSANIETKDKLGEVKNKGFLNALQGGLLPTFEYLIEKQNDDI